MVRSLLIIVGMAVLPSFLWAQAPTLTTKNKKAIEWYVEADNYRVRRQFKEAIELLTNALAKDANFVEAYYRLGLTYMSMRDYATAIVHFETGLQKTNETRIKKVFWFDLGECYMELGQYAKAEQTMNEFLKVEAQQRGKIERAKQVVANAVFAQQHAQSVSGFVQAPLNDTVNSAPLQYFPVLTADQQMLIFTRRSGHTDEFDEDLVAAIKDKQGRWTSPVSLSSNINSTLNEGTCTISADGRKIIFTSCVGRKGFGSCDLYESQRTGNVWSVPVNLGPNINSVEWESQPALSADGRTLYFVSDRRGGMGRRDIWQSTMDESGKWAKARNMGKVINTVYDEISPFIHVNNRTFYFASMGQAGFGGYDLYYSERDTTGAWTKPVNMGSPINNHEDQFSLFITSDGKKGYYSHEEMVSGGRSLSKIYEISIPESQQIRYKSNYITGRVFDKQTKKPLSARIELVNLGRDSIESIVGSDSLTGDYLMVLTQGAEYALYVNKKGYLFQSLNFNYSGVSDFKPIRMDIYLEQALKGSVSVMNNIFFDFNKYDLKEKSETELQKIARFLRENPLASIEIGGHTDSMGAAVYNRELSEKRARSVQGFLVKQGIDIKRITVKGYGPDRPVAPNDTEEGRALNRRIEFKIL